MSKYLSGCICKMYPSFGLDMFQRYQIDAHVSSYVKSWQH